MQTRRTVTTGAAFAVIGLLFLVLSFKYPMGTIARMGPGWFPAAVASLLLVLGAAMLVTGITTGRPEHVTFGRRDVVCVAVVCGSLVAFGLVLPIFGLFPATVVLVAVAMIGYGARSWAAYIVLPVVLAAAVTLLFGLILNLPVPILSAGGL